MLLVFVAVFILLFEHVLPMLIVRRDPERVLECCCRRSTIAARFLQPLTSALVRLMVEGRRERERQAAPTPRQRRRTPARPRTPTSRRAKSRD